MLEVDLSKKNQIENTNEQINKKKEIDAIFQAIFESLNTNNSFLNNHGFQSKLQQYQTALLEEINYLDPKYDHPLRAARALQKAIEQPLEANCNAFQKEAANSKFNPNARALAWGLLAALLVAVVFSLLIGGIVAAVGSGGAFLPTVGLAFALCSTTLSLVGGFLADANKLESYEPVVKAKKIGDDIATGLNLFNQKSKTAESAETVPYSVKC